MLGGFLLLMIRYVTHTHQGGNTTPLVTTGHSYRVARGCGWGTGDPQIGSILCLCQWRAAPRCSLGPFGASALGPLESWAPPPPLASSGGGAPLKSGEKKNLLYTAERAGIIGSTKRTIYSIVTAASRSIVPAESIA